MFNETFEWLQEVLSDSGSDYKFMLGQWIEKGPEDANKMFAVLRQTGGTRPDTDVRRKSYNIYLVGKRNSREDTAILDDDMESLLMKAINDNSILPCNAARVNAMSEPSGPNFTIEDRAVFSLVIEVIF